MVKLEKMFSGDGWWVFEGVVTKLLLARLFSSLDTIKAQSQAFKRRQWFKVFRNILLVNIGYPPGLCFIDQQSANQSYTHFLVTEGVERHGWQAARWNIDYYCSTVKIVNISHPWPPVYFGCTDGFIWGGGERWGDWINYSSRKL